MPIFVRHAELPEPRLHNHYVTLELEPDQGDTWRATVRRDGWEGVLLSTQGGYATRQEAMAAVSEFLSSLLPPIL